MIESKAIRLHDADNVVVARAELPTGTVLPEENVTCKNPIPAGHKVATAPIEKGEIVRKYNQVIGVAGSKIAPGEHVHTHNLKMHAVALDYAISEDLHTTAYFPESERPVFQGIVRPDGRVATRNYIGVLSTVNCSATAARLVADAFRGDALKDYPNVDGVVALPHWTGCGMSGDGEGNELLRRTMEGYAKHPNFAGVVIVGLGCEINEMGPLCDQLGLIEGPFFRAMTIQGTKGGTRSTVEKGVNAIREMLEEANRIERTPVPADRLLLALECGGSDAYSGITANPALGAAADLLVRHGGTAVVSETPEIYGAEHLLTRRAVTPEVAKKLIERIKWWEDYTTRNKNEMNNNPSPGNKAGGLTTILEKSLGAVAKGGTTNLVEVYGYAEPVTAKGFVFMDTPGYDPVSVTGMVAGGANVICFTTGRGSAFGCKPVPSIKLATSSALYNRQTEDMDINCGVVLDKGVSVEEMGAEIFKKILETASGKKTKSELIGVGDHEFSPWHVGATM